MNKFKLTSAIIALVLGSTMITNAQALTRQLQLGMTGSDVGVLQSFLAKDPSIYPEALITNYFGSLTRAAVLRFQAKFGISQVGRVGPQTMAEINRQMGMNTGGNTSTNPGVNPISNVMIYNATSYTATTTMNNASSSIPTGTVGITWSTPVPTRATVYYSTTPLTTYENENSVTISGSTVVNNNYGNSNTIWIPNLSSNTTYYYSIYTTDQNGNVNMTWPATFRVN